MSTKRILIISAIGVLFIAVFVGVMLIASYMGRVSTTVQLPETVSAPVIPSEAVTDTLDRVEVNRETVQDVVATLSRPDTYSREVIIELYSESGQAVYNISVNTDGGITSLRVRPSVGEEKRIIITPETLYIWTAGDREPYSNPYYPGVHGDAARTSDEWQMMVSFEDLLAMDAGDIIDAGYIEFGGENCVYAVYLTPLFGYTGKYHISIELGLLTGAEEYDSSGALIYRMTAGECTIGESDAADFALPDGTSVVKAAEA